jgi:hypothetical protein
MRHLTTALLALLLAWPASVDLLGKAMAGRGCRSKRSQCYGRHKARTVCKKRHCRHRKKRVRVIYVVPNSGQPVTICYK